jgi:hypothetical protein
VVKDTMRVRAALARSTCSRSRSPEIRRAAVLERGTQRVALSHLDARAQGLEQDARLLEQLAQRRATRARLVAVRVAPIDGVDHAAGGTPSSRRRSAARARAGRGTPRDRRRFRA